LYLGSIPTNPPAEFLELEEYPQPPLVDIEKLVQKVRSQRFEKIQYQCSILQLLNISRPVALDDIYIGVKVASLTRAATQRL
jgi:predicted NACHT family NTPase